MVTRTDAISSSFIWRRVHSLMGLWLVLYLIVHLITNSQAALWLDDNGIGFVRMVNQLESLPYLQVIETIFIGIPLGIHAFWGVKRALGAKTNSNRSDGSTPSLPFARNRAFTWQRLSSWILLIGILGHVVQMRFVQAPKKIHVGNETVYAVSLKEDPELKGIAERLRVTLIPGQNGVVAQAKTPGKAMLLMVRETFKSPLLAVLYSIFVLAAAFHAFNGFWTSLITWGAILSYRSQRAFLPICWLGTGVLAFLGFAAIWGSYFLTFRN